MTRQLEILLSEVNGRVAVSRELLAKSGLSQEIINDLDGLFLIIKSFNDIISALRKENEDKQNIINWYKDVDTIQRMRIEELRADNESISNGRTAYAKTCSVLSEENFNLQKRIEELENPIPCSHPKIVSVAHAYMCEECKKCLI